MIDASGAPIANVMLLFTTAEGPHWLQSSRSDADGRFLVPNCPPDTRLSLTARAIGMQQLAQRDIDPTAGPLELRMQPAATTSP